MKQWFLLAFWALCAGGVMAEEALQPREMIDALKPRTRSLRNLGIRQVEPPIAAASAPAEKPLPTDVPVAVQASAGAGVVLADVAPPSLSMAIGFEFNSARINASSEKLLGNLAAALLSDELKNIRFRVEGHTDAKGGAAYNLRLSQLRAQEVKRFLVARGVAENRLQSQGFGSGSLADPRDPQGAVNRRVRIVTLE